MLFSVVSSLPSESSRGREHIYLVADNWDDWGKYRTMFTVYVVDRGGVTHEPGSTKIGQVGLQPRSGREPLEEGFRAPTVPRSFDALGSGFFSIGQTENFYETLNLLDPDFKDQILRGLSDCAFDLSTFDTHSEEYVMGESLLRNVSASSVRNRFHRLANGNAVLTRFEFQFQFPGETVADIPPPCLDFLVIPDSQPPTNIHVLIGRNGVGKTKCVQRLTSAVLGLQLNDENPGEISRIGLNEEWEFASLVLVSFSVFDKFMLPASQITTIRANQVGLKYRDQADAEGVLRVKTETMLAEDFAESFGQCRRGPRAMRWQAAIQTLESDPLFDEADVGRLMTLSDDEWRPMALRFFEKLSSGHAIVLLTITRLVELVDERTFVILDEPEGHLHPPLLAAFVRAMSDLLVKRNGVALVATHSPVLLQEVPSSCVWKLQRSGRVSVAERPSIETFGENVGVLTREAFGLQVTDSGFHSLLRKVAESSQTFDECLAKFDDQLGAEAKAILMSIFARRSGAAEPGNENAP